MKKFIKQFITLCLLGTIVITSTVDSYAAKTSRYGFTYNNSYYNANWKTMETIYVYSSKGGKLGSMSFVVGLARRKKTNNYLLMAKEIMTPNKNKVKLDSKNTYGYGMSEYVSVKSTLPGTLEDYRPVNNPSTDEVTLSLGVSKKDTSVSASYTISHKDLDITAKCNTPDSKYHIVYNYDPTIANPIGNNKYLAYESSQYGLAQFNCKDKIAFTINYDARFGAAENSKCSPWMVYMNYVKKKTDSRKYTFSISKK